MTIGTAVILRRIAQGCYVFRLSFDGGGDIARGNSGSKVIDTMPHGSGMGRIHRSSRDNGNFFVWTME